MKVSTCECGVKEACVALQALEEEHRIDGRRPFDLRKLQLQVEMCSAATSRENDCCTAAPRGFRIAGHDTQFKLTE